MTSIFDFTKMYSGVIRLGEEVFPCTLSFPDCRINFKVVGNPERQHSGKLCFSGYVSTELGIKNYKARHAIQTRWSSGSHGLSHQEFEADQLLTGDLDAEIELESFKQVSLVYPSLHKIGNFIETPVYDTDKLSFRFEQIFPSLVLKETEKEKLSLENPVRYKRSAHAVDIFSLWIEPFFSYETSGISLEQLQLFSNRLGWFIQLIFDIKQQPADLFLFEKSTKNIPAEKQRPFYYLAPELIRRKQHPAAVHRFPAIELELLKDQLPGCYSVWDKMNPAQQKLSALFFQ